MSDQEVKRNESVRDLAALVVAAGDVANWIQATLDGFPPLTPQRYVRDPFGFVGRSVLVRQCTALRAALVLIEADLGHTALPMVRTACDELIWMKYLGSLNDGKRNDLLHALHAIESARIINAQQQELGTRMMTRVGFPKGFVKVFASRRADWEARLKQAGQDLGWPADLKHVPPGAGWIAGQIGLDSLHAFLYSASSKGVHFSVSEHFRSGYFGEGPDAVIHLAAPTYVAYRSAFTIFWLSYLLVRTAAEVGGELPEFREPAESADDFLPIIHRLMEHGKVPIVMPFEFNLEEQQQPRS